MRVGLAFIVGQLGLGGAEQQLYYLLAGIDRARFRPIVFNLGSAPDEYWQKPIVELGIRVRHVSKRLGRAGRTLQIADILRREKAQIVHGWVFHTNPYSAICGRLAKIPVRLGSMREDYSGLPKARFLKWLGSHGLDILITNSRENARKIVDFAFTNAPVRTVPNGVPLSEPVTPIQRNQLRSRLGYFGSELVIGSIGRIDENKNYAMLLRVFASLTTKWPMARLLIIGEGPLRSHLLAMAEEMGVAPKVKLPGSLPRAAEFLPAIDIGCLTSHTEGKSNFIMEAAAAGVPMISTHCGDSAELIEHGITGYIVPTENETSMANNLEFLFASPKLRCRMGKGARQKMQREFSIESMIARMTNIYEDALVAKGVV